MYVHLHPLALVCLGLASFDIATGQKRLAPEFLPALQATYPAALDTISSMGKVVDVLFEKTAALA